MSTCAGCGRQNPEEAWFCSACGASVGGQERREERKVVTVLFCDLVGFTSRAERLAAELLAHAGRRAETDVQLAGALAFYRQAGTAANVRRAEALLARPA